jgi:DNA-binding GntR family transcriptional regulator
MENKTNFPKLAYQKIKEMMFHYQIIPGQRLVMVDLTKKIGMSRTPINQALSILASEGYVDFIPHQGYIVHEITQDEAKALYQVRSIIELGAIEFTIRNLTPKKIEVLKEKKDLLSNKLNSGQVTRENFIFDLEFHTCYIEMAGNPYLTNCYREVYQRIFLRHRLEGLSIARNKQADMEHDEIFKAIYRRNIRKAKEAIKKHIKAAENSIFSSFS